MMLEDLHTFKGMKRGVYPIKQDKEFLWDALDIRLTNRYDDTLLSITCDAGNKEVESITFNGKYLGHCLLGKYLVVFTVEGTNKDKTTGRIYRISKTSEGAYESILLCESNTLNFDINFPIESLGVYESEFLQKVYWIDGKNQPRVINITKIELDNAKSKDGKYNNVYPPGSFDFIPDLKLEEQVEVEKIYGNGMFSPGTIQYAFTYFNKYAQESNIFYTTPLYYTSASQDRAGDPEEKVANSFKITITDLDDKFDHIRIYSIHRTTLDATPTVKIVEDIEITKDQEPITFIDDGTKGDTIEESRLLFIGGEYIVPNCMTQKDGTLFLGNITQDTTNVESEFIEAVNKHKNTFTYSDFCLGGNSNINYNNDINYDNNTKYEYSPNLTEYSGTFKYGEYYKLALQGQFSNGKWTAPVYIGTKILNGGELTEGKNSWNPVRSSKAIGLGNLVEDLKELGIKRLRTCVSFPKTYERTKICQGILCPTVYTLKDRISNSPYAASSWFIRPITNKAHLENNRYDSIYNASNIEFRHNRSLKTAPDPGAEVQSMSNYVVPEIYNFVDNNKDNQKKLIDNYSSYYYIDSNIVTFHSPDIEFDDNLQNFIWDDVKLRIIGIAPLCAISSDMKIVTSSTKAISSMDPSIPEGYGFNSPLHIKANGGLVAGPFYKDAIIRTKDDEVVLGDSKYWMTYPWQRTGSLNNDSVRDDGSQTSLLSTKKISNLKFFGTPLGIQGEGNDPFWYNITTPQLFMPNEVSMLKIPVDTELIEVKGEKAITKKNQINYVGNIDTATSRQYKLFSYDNFFDNSPSENVEGSDVESSLPIRIKYKSTPHMVFALKPRNDEPYKKDEKKYLKIPILPTISDSSISGYKTESTGIRTQLNVSKINTDSAGLISTVNHDRDSFFTPPDKSQKGTYGIWAKLNNDNKTYNLVMFEDVGNKWKDVWETIGTKVLCLKPEYTTISCLHLSNSPESAVPDIPHYMFPETDIEDYKKVVDNGIINEKLFVYKGPLKYYKYDKNSQSLVETKAPPGNSGDDTVTQGIEQLTFKIKEDDVTTIKGKFPSFILIGELYKDTTINTPSSTEELKSLLWVPSSKAYNIGENSNTLSIPFSYGDTFYTRYDCLKTYPFTNEDENQIVEIGSFMVESNINLDGRYDKNRGLSSNINVSTQNFNQINRVYSQKDNVFPNRILDDDFYKQSKFENQVVWSLPKTPTDTVDSWTNLVLANSIHMPGHYGKVTALTCFNDNLLCLQDKAISEILYNSKVQIPVSNGVPIEIGNSYKVDGYRVINSTIGCQDKWSVVNANSGIYFIDKLSSTLWSFNGQLSNVSDTLGMREWFKLSLKSSDWVPEEVALNGIRSFYDKLHGDIYFVPGPEIEEEGKDNRKALCFSEMLGNFTSFMSYNGAVCMESFDSELISLYDNGRLNMYLHKEDDSGARKVFGKDILPSFTFISNDNPTVTKIFDTVETRADALNSNGNMNIETHKPIFNLQVSNEYQDTGAVGANLNQKYKFRIWRMLIPRNKNTRQRIRNPWAKIKIGLNPSTILHDISVKYTV